MALPVLEIVPVNVAGDQRRAIQDQLADADALLWTSAHAVRLFPLPPVALESQPRLFAVGQRTAAAASEKFQQKVDFPRLGHGGAAWLDQFGHMLRPGQTLVVLTGEGGQREWAKPLQQRGVKVVFVALYRRQAKVVPLPDEVPDVVVATSGAALAALDACQLPPPIKHSCLLLPAERLVLAAQQQGWSGRIASLRDLSPPAVLSALEECR